MFQLMITHGVLKTANVQSYLYPIYHELDVLSKVGIKVKTDDGNYIQAKVHLLTFTGDIPAVASVINHAGHMHTNGCRICDDSGLRPIGESGMFFLGRANKTVRTVESFRNAIEQVN
jgi:hypothetical protein